MSGLQRVSFSKKRAALPRLSAPYVPGRRSPRFWNDAEKDVIKKYYPIGGSLACLAHLPPHRTPSGVYQQAKQLDLSCPQGMAAYKNADRKITAPAGFDDTLRHEYEQQDGKKRGAINAIADKLNLPRWWVTKRAIALGLTMPHKKEPDWTAAELELIKKVPLHDLFRCSKIFREHGFARSPSAIMVKSKRLNLSRRFREGFTAGQAAKIVGFDGSLFSKMVIAGEVKAERRRDQRLPQQGGSRWIITHEDLRAFAITHLDRIDLRKVDKHGFVQLLLRTPLEAENGPTAAPGRPRRRISELAAQLSQALDEAINGTGRRP